MTVFPKGIMTGVDCVILSLSNVFLEYLLMIMMLVSTKGDNNVNSNILLFVVLLLCLIFLLNSVVRNYQLNYCLVETVSLP